MSDSEMLIGSQNLFGLQFGKGQGLAVDAERLGRFVATGFGSRGGPNKISNKLKRNPISYLLRNHISPEYFLATALRSRGGPNKVTNKLKRCLGSYLYD